MQLRNQLHARGARPNDGDLQLRWPQGRVLGVGAQASIQHAAVEALGIHQVLQLERVLIYAGGAKIIAAATHRYHQGVVGKGALGGYCYAILINKRGNVH